MLIQRAVLMDGRTVDIRLGDRIQEVADTLAPRPGETVFDAAGGAVIPGLHDHHVHLRAAAAAAGSVQVGPAHVHNRAQLAAVLAGAPVGGDGWIRAVGYHESAGAGPLDRSVLDELGPEVPVRVQHRSGVLWILNSLGLAAVGLRDHPDGRLRSHDTWADSVARRDTPLAELSERLSRYGVTGVTDATPDLDADAIVTLTQAHRHGELHQRVSWLSPGKRILHDDGLDLDELSAWIRARHVHGPVAVHCVTAAQLVVTLAALRATGRHPGDRIEHAAVVPQASLAELAELDPVVVTQPNFVAERGDQYLLDVAAEDQPGLWRLASLRRAGVRVALSTDLPFGGADPWAVMRAAVHRTTGTGAVLNADECVTATTALSMFTGHADRPDIPRCIEPGQPGDVCVLAATPAAVLDALDAELVRATVVGGEVRVSSSRP